MSCFHDRNINSPLLSPNNFIIVTLEILQLHIFKLTTLYIFDTFLLNGKYNICFSPLGLKMSKSTILTNVEAICKHGILMLIYRPVNVNCRSHLLTELYHRIVPEKKRRIPPVRFKGKSALIICFRTCHLAAN